MDLLIAACVDEEVMLWKMSSLKFYHQFDHQDDSNIRGLKPFISNNDRAMLASVNEDEWFHVLEIEEKKVVYEVQCEDHRFHSLDVFEEDGNCVFIAGGFYSRRKKGSMVFIK